jgi:motility quorum-sensing regulator/GCU-specific mRNA interferase toxin
MFNQPPVITKIYPIHKFRLTWIYPFHKLSGMEKQTAHYDLAAIKRKIMSDGIFTFTALARKGVDALGLSEAEAVGVLLSLQRGQLFKSMTTHADHRVWHNQPLATVFWLLSGVASSSIRTFTTPPVQTPKPLISN